MADTKIDPAAVTASYQRLLDAANAAPAGTLREVAAAHDELQSGFAEAAKRLVASRGDADPAVLAFGAASDSLAAAGTALQLAADRQSRIPQLKPSQGMVIGTVVDTSGAAVSGLRVSFGDAAGAAGDSSVTTDASGDFTLVYDARKMAGAGAPLALVLLDASGKAVYTASGRVTPAPLRVDRFEIVLASQPRRSRPPGPKAGSGPQLSPAVQRAARPPARKRGGG